MGAPTAAGYRPPGQSPLQHLDSAGDKIFAGHARQEKPFLLRPSPLTADLPRGSGSKADRSHEPRRKEPAERFGSMLRSGE